MITPNSVRPDTVYGTTRPLSANGSPMKGNDLLLIRGGTERTFKRGERIFSVDDPAHGLFYITKGNIKVCRMGILGKEQIVRLAREGDLLGYRSVISGERHSTTAVALEDATLYFIHRDTFLRLCSLNDGLSQKILTMLADELKTAQGRIVAMAQKSTKSRLAEALLQLSEICGVEPEDKALRVNITRQELADLIGTATESVIRILSEFRQERIIGITRRRIRILDRKALQATADASI